MRLRIIFKKNVSLQPISNFSVMTTKEEIPDIVLSLLGAGAPVADDDLNARKAYSEYLAEP